MRVNRVTAGEHLSTEASRSGGRGLLGPRRPRPDKHLGLRPGRASRGVDHGAPPARSRPRPGPHQM
eukprot:1180561-Prorocentrum_minimum.AAC.10